MKGLKLAWRGPLLMIFPLVCQSMFLLAVILMLNGAKESLERASHTREGLLQLNKITSDFFDNLAFQEDKSEKYQGKGATDTSDFEEINKIVNTIPEANSEKLRGMLVRLNSIFDYSVQSLKANVPNKGFLRRNIVTKAFQILPSFLDEMNAVMKLSNKFRDEQFENSVKIKNRIITLIQVAITVSVIAAGAMFFLFVISIKRPIEHLTENSRRLSRKEILLPALSGNDELSKLDRSLHQTYEAVIHSSDRELALINNVADLVCSLSANGTFTQCNSAATRITGWNAEQLIGKSIADLVIPAESLLAEEYIRNACKSSETSHFELKIKGLENNEIETLWSCTWSALPETLFCVVRDVTTEKANARMKQDFIDMVSHDLRSPLTSLGITLELIEHGGLGQVNQLAMQELRSTNKNVQTLISFINDLLDFQKLDEGKIHLETSYCGIAGIIKEAIALVKETAWTKNIEIQYTARDFEILCDSGKITQTVLNLLTNAIKFSPKDSTIIVTTSVDDDDQNSDSIKVSVTDNGPGLSEELRGRVFDPFEQAPAHQNQGTGLGLAICKMIIDAHGGTIGISDTQTGYGSEFWFKIPIAGPKAIHSDDRHDDSSTRNLFMD